MSKFGHQLRMIRKSHGLTQRRLAALVGIDFTYLSKIESGAVAPPSDAVIARLAVTLAADSDALFLLANRVPPRIREMLSREDISFVRTLRSQLEYRQ